MIATQYEIVLPRDYDMNIIRERVASRGHALDARKGLGLKAYLVRDVAEGSELNSYAPFYFWNDTNAAAEFFWRGAGFSGIVSDFGRPPVQTWVGDAFVLGAASGQPPTHAVKVTRSLDEGDPVQFRLDRRQEYAYLADEPGLHSSGTGFDPRRWEWLHFCLFASLDDARALQRTACDIGATAVRYSVLHLSSPEISRLL